MDDKERADKAEEFIREIAWRFSDHARINWSRQDILAHIADYFGITVKQLDEQMTKAGE